MATGIGRQGGGIWKSAMVRGGDGEGSNRDGKRVAMGRGTTSGGDGDGGNGEGGGDGKGGEGKEVKMGKGRRRGKRRGDDGMPGWQRL